MVFIYKNLFSCFVLNTVKRYSHTNTSVRSVVRESFVTGYLQKLKPPQARRHYASAPDSCKPNLTFESCVITQFAVTEEIQFYRDSRNNFEGLYSNKKEPYGPPLAILLPWKDLNPDLLKKFVEIYGEKGFDVLSVHLTTEQFMYPCVVGSAMNVVTDLIDYLNEVHSNRPYVFHGFSIGSYIFGEIMAQFSDNYDSCRSLVDNVRGCLWDSPVDVISVRPQIGKAFYPKSFIKRWRCNRDVKRHFKKHYHDSVAYWLRSRNNFCNPIVKVPYVFYTSHSDTLSNPCTLQSVQKTLECNGIPIYQKTWWDSSHGHHFMKYCYEYLYGMTLFFNVCNLFPDECGKYKCCPANATLSSLRLSKTARETLSS